MSTSLSYAGKRPRTRRSQHSDRVRTAVFPTDLGWIAAAWQADRICRLTFGHRDPQEAWEHLHVEEAPTSPDRFLNNLIRRFERFSRGRGNDCFRDVQLAAEGMTAFQQAVTESCRQIPVGQTRSYGELAEIVGHPRAARAVGSVMAKNRFPLIVPCHRVVGANGTLGGFSSPEGISMKRRLLAMEQTMVASR